MEDLETELREYEEKLGLRKEQSIKKDRPCVMVVDDDPGFLKSLVDTLNGDYEVIACASGREALEKLIEKVCTVILDIKMPGMTGLEVMRQIKNRNKDLPVIFNTGYPGEYIESRIEADYEPFGYVTKDKPQVLLAHLKSAIKHFNLTRNYLDLIKNLEKQVEERTEQYRSEKEIAEELAVELKELNQQLKVAYSDLEKSSTRILTLTQELNAEKSVAMRGSQAHDILHQQKNHLALVATNLEFTYRTIDKLNTTFESVVAALPEEQKVHYAEDIQVARSSYARTQKVKPLIFEGMDNFNLIYGALDRLSKDDGSSRNIKEDLESLIFILADNYAQHGITFEKDIKSIPTPKLYGPLVNDIYINYVQNAFEELTKQRNKNLSNLKILIKTAIAGDKLVVEVHDTGSGIKEEDRERVFELFVSEKGRGTGLPTCRRIADKFGAKVYNARSDVEGYTTKFVAQFPLEKK